MCVLGGGGWVSECALCMFLSAWVFLCVCFCACVHIWASICVYVHSQYKALSKTSVVCLWFSVKYTKRETKQRCKMKYSCCCIMHLTPFIHHAEHNPNSTEQDICLKVISDVTKWHNIRIDIKELNNYYQLKQLYHNVYCIKKYFLTNKNTYKTNVRIFFYSSMRDGHRIATWNGYFGVRLAHSFRSRSGTCVTPQVHPHDHWCVWTASLRLRSAWRWPRRQ